jgi:tRNA G18 (ribose-2'-O)-methylase SpoU
LFTKRKFLKLPLKQQHKKCAEVLKVAYENTSPDALQHYLELRNWMGNPFSFPSNQKEIADAYHKHLQVSEFCFKEHNLLPSIRKGDKHESHHNLELTIYLDHLRSGHNVGSIIRTVEAFSLGKLYFSENTPFIDNKKVQDAAMGSDQYVQCFQNFKLENLPKPIIVLETSNEAISLYDFIFPETFTLVCGNEEYGCSDDTLKLANYILEIPLSGRKNSLNVANAFAITASEIVRQKHCNTVTKTCQKKTLSELN